MNVQVTGDTEEIEWGGVRCEGELPTRIGDRTTHPAKEVHGDRPQRGHVLRPVAGTDAGGVLAEGHIPHIMDLVVCPEHERELA
jgi:hypothetical protein